MQYLIPVAPQGRGGDRYDDESTGPHQTDHFPQRAHIVIHVLKNVHESDDGRDAGRQVDRVDAGQHRTSAGGFHSRSSQNKALVVIIEGYYPASGGHLNGPCARPHTAVNEDVVTFQLNEMVDPDLTISRFPR